MIMNFTRFQSFYKFSRTDFFVVKNFTTCVISRTCLIFQFKPLLIPVNYFSTSNHLLCDDHVKSSAPEEVKKTSLMVSRKYFDYNDDDKNKESFEGAIDIFTHKDTRRRGSVEFIYAAMRNMQKFGVHRDLTSYKKLMDVFPKGKMIPENRLQSDFFYYPKQQQCAVSLLVQMEKNKVIPDEEMGDILLNVFGKYATPYKRYCRMMYWLPKFKNMSPFPLPHDLPNDAVELATLAIKQITSVDPLTEVKVIKTADVVDFNDDTWVVTGQSGAQRSLLEDLPTGTALYVEGAFRVWLKDSQVSYFILRGPPVPTLAPPEVDDDELGTITRWMDGEKSPAGTVMKMPGVHEQEDGTILAVCASGTSSRDSLLSWVRNMEIDIPDLSRMAVLFTLTSPLGPVIPVKESSGLSHFSS